MQIETSSLSPPLPPPKNTPKDAPLNFVTMTKIENHWNDLPKTLLHKNDNTNHEDVEPTAIVGILRSILETCKSNGLSQKMILDDTTRRINSLLELIESGKVKSSVLVALDQICTAFESREWDKVLKVQGDLMRTEYEKPDGKWVPGIKRLVELYPKEL